MRLMDRNREEPVTSNFEESSIYSNNSSYWSFVRRRLFSGLPYRGALRLGRNTLQRFVESEDERSSVEDTMDWNHIWSVTDIRDTQMTTPTEDSDAEVIPRGFFGYAHVHPGSRVIPMMPSVNQRTIPTSTSLPASQMPVDFIPFLTQPPSSESLFPCPEQWSPTLSSRQETSVTNRSQQSGIRRRYLDVLNSRHLESQRTHEEGSLWGGRSTSRRRLNRWPGFESVDNSPATEEKELDYSIPAFSSFLGAGQEFKGFQRCTRREGNDFVSGQPEDWAAQVYIKEYNAHQGYLCGIMEAYVNRRSPVVTFWEGEIIDNKNYTFKTNKWSTFPRTDIDYWNRFSAFRNLRRPLQSDYWLVPGLKEYPYIFMRWKETFFITKPEENSLTIQGFYYICLCRATGEINGYYYDPSSNPFQELELHPNRHGHPGLSFSHYEFR